MVKIIAEAGVNHNGSLETALRMVDTAVDAHADYIKFQTFKTEALVTGDCKAASYQTANSGAENQAEMLSRLELSYGDFRRLSEYCKIKGIGFLTTPFDMESIDFVASLRPDFIKVPSGEITNLPYLRHVADTRIPVILSSGMCVPADIKAALCPFIEAGYGNEDIILLHCTTQYPAPLSDINLRAMDTLKKEFGYEVGYSDHTAGITVAVAAAALGAAVIEKHFTLSRKMEGPDHMASLEPHELKKMVESVRDVELALGSPEKCVADSEKHNISAARRSIVAARHIPKGKVLEAADLCAKRPGTGISPMLWDTVIGKTAPRDFYYDEQIEL